MYKVDCVYHVIKIEDDYAAIGSGDDLALGVMSALYPNMVNPINIITRALEISSKYNIGISPPFYVEALS